MTMNKHLEPAAGALRLRAEEKEVDNCRRNPELLEPLSSETAGRLLHELRVHQIELEMQNEELRVKQAELEVSQARYFNFYNLAPVGYLTISEKGLIEEANLTISTLLGLPEKSLVGRMVSSFIFSEDQDGYYLFIKKLFASTASGACELRLMKPDGEKLWGRMEVALTQDLGGNLVVRAVVSEISAMKKAEEDLHIIAERLELVMEASGAGIWDQDLTTGAVFLDRQWKAIIGYKEDEIKNKSSEWQNRIYPQDALLLQQSISGAQKRKESKYEAEYRLLHKDGTYRWIRTVGKITYDAKHQPSRLTGINVDITDQKNLADLQHESENRLKDFAQAVPDISFVIDEDGRFIEVFGADKALFPVVKKNIRGRTVFEVYPAAMANKLMEDIKRSIEKKSSF